MAKKRNKTTKKPFSGILQKLGFTPKTGLTRKQQAAYLREQKQAVAKNYNLNDVTPRTSWNDIKKSVNRQQRENTINKKAAAAIKAGAKPENLNRAKLNKVKVSDLSNVSRETYPDLFEPLVVGAEKPHKGKEYLYVGLSVKKSLAPIKDVETLGIFYNLYSTETLVQKIKEKLNDIAEGGSNPMNAGDGFCMAFDDNNPRHIEDFERQGYQTLCFSNIWTAHGAAVMIYSAISNLPVDTANLVYRTAMKYFKRNHRQIFKKLSE